MKKFAVLFLFLSACHPSSHWLTNPPEKVTGFTAGGGAVTKDIYNTCELVFVLDDSGSMSQKVANVRSAIGRWAHAFLDQNPIHCHIGLMRNFDDYGHDRGQYTAQSAPGFLVPLANGKRWIDSEDPEAIDLIVQAMSEYKEIQPSKGGSTYEALFSPIIAFFNPLSEAHKRDLDFFMGKDSTTIIMMVTDANDQSKEVFPENVAEMLWAQKGVIPQESRKKVITLGALLMKNQGDCRVDDAGVPVREAELVRQTGGQVFNVCDRGFGDSLAQYGRNLRTRTIRRAIRLGGLVEVYREQKMDLPMDDCSKVSDPHDLRVYYGPFSGDPSQICKNTMLKRGEGGYHYNPDKQQITIGDDFAYKTCANCKIQIAATPISDNAISNGTAKPNDVPAFKNK